MTCAGSSPSPPTAVAIVGAGALGFGLAIRLGRAGVPVAVGSRVAERAEEVAERAGRLVPEGSFLAAENRAAVRLAETVFLSVPFHTQAETLSTLHGSLRPGQLLIDVTVPLARPVNGGPMRMLGVWQGSAAQQAQETAPEGVRVVSALQTLSARVLADLDQELGDDVLLCGDRREDKRRAAEVIERIDGLRCVDCGGLEMARITESLTALLMTVNARHRTHTGIRLTRVPDERWDLRD